jgi:hypothetical protein
MFNNVYRADITVSLTGGGDAGRVLYDYPPLHHLKIACGRTEIVAFNKCLSKKLLNAKAQRGGGRRAIAYPLIFINGQGKPLSLQNE